jgi:hypothetical protein
MRTYKGIITELPSNGVFVFGSNTEGRHGKGAALVARTRFGARYGQAFGLQGKSYAIVTKDLRQPQHPSVPRHLIVMQISNLFDFAADNLNLDFYIAYSGQGSNLNGYTPEEMAQMFIEAGYFPSNIIFEESFANLMQANIQSR